MSLRTITVDTAATVLGFILAGAVGASGYYLKGHVSKEELIAAFIFVGGGWYIKRGDTTPFGGGK